VKEYGISEEKARIDRVKKMPNSPIRQSVNPSVFQPFAQLPKHSEIPPFLLLDHLIEFAFLAGDYFHGKGSLHIAFTEGFSDRPAEAAALPAAVNAGRFRADRRGTDPQISRLYASRLPAALLYFPAICLHTDITSSIGLDFSENTEIFPFFFSDETVELAHGTVSYLPGERPLHFSLAECPRQCPAETAAVISPVGVASIAFRSRRADAQYTRVGSPRFSPASLELPTV
jgi:hypothetical protein